jgi:hypothetical protein
MKKKNLKAKKNIDLRFELISCEMFKTEFYTTKHPLTTIYENTNKLNTYTVNVATFIPRGLKKISASKELYFPLVENEIFLKYSNELSIINLNNNDTLPNCANLSIVCESNGTPEEYNLYYFQFDVLLAESHFNELECIYINSYFINSQDETIDDPETSRGTVTGVRRDG